MGKNDVKPPRTLSPSELYELREIQRLLGLSAWSIWRARRGGLRIHRISGREFVLGKDFVEYLEFRTSQRQAKKRRPQTHRTKLKGPHDGPRARTIKDAH